MPGTTAPWDAWNIRDSDFPHARGPEERMQFLLRYAMLAPSSHNSQPWRFRTEGDVVELYADRLRSLPVADPADRELIMSCGAALHHLRLAMRHFGFVPQVEILPGGDLDLLARVRLDGPCEPTPEEELLFHVIRSRRTNRLAFQDRDVPPAVLAALSEAAGSEGCWLHVVSGAGAREELADLIARGDRHQMADEAFRRELAEWIHPRRIYSHDGLGTGSSETLDPLIAPLTSLVVRTFDLGPGRAARDRELATGSPVLAVLGSEREGYPDWLAAGQGLSKVLLRARAEGVWASFLNQPIEVPALRLELQRLLARGGRAQLLLRLGYGVPVPPTPRRPVRETLI